MNNNIKGFSLFAAALLASCAHQADTKKASNTASVKATRKAVPPALAWDAVAPREPLPLPGLRTVDDVLSSLAPYVVSQLKPDFDRAGVAYPPRELALIALKEERRLEVWARDLGPFRFIRDYPIRAASGKAGPKLRQGDRQVPEGVYRIVRLNPNSNYHLSMKLNYPNDFDLFHADQEGRWEPGSDIFIHGDSVSSGCLAMGDAAIEELFVLAAHVGPENIRVVIAPHDPRTRPLDPNQPGLPSWSSELYEEITRQILAVSNSEPVKVSSNRPAQNGERKTR